MPAAEQTQQHPVAAPSAAALDDETKQIIRDALESVSKTAGFRPRGAQRLMIAEVAKTLSGEYDGERVLCVEGPTGTGKSLGYLLSAIPVAKARGKSLVISTATVALQEQLVTKDLPDVQVKTGLEFSYALAKGRRRYACDRNLKRLAGFNKDQGNLDFGDNQPEAAQWNIKPRDGDVELVQKMWQARQDGSFSGDLDEWPGQVRSELKQEITTDKSGCTGRNCPFYSQCAFFQARNERKEKDVIVANHALVMADLMLGGGIVLPPPEDTIYIFDEGHHLPDAAIRQGQAQTRLVGPHSWLNHLAQLATRAARGITADPDTAQDIVILGAAIDKDMPRLVESLADIHRHLEAVHPCVSANQHKNKAPNGSRNGYNNQPDTNWRFTGGVVPEDLQSLFKHAKECCATVYGNAMKLNAKGNKALGKEPDNSGLGSAQSSIQWTTAKLEGMYTALTQMSASDPDNPYQPPVARWIECFDGGRDFACNATPTSAANKLRSVLWEQCDGAIVTSATLAALERFDRFFEHAGLSERFGNRGLRLASPFDYPANAELCIPATRANPKNHDEHTRDIIDRIDGGLIDPAAGTLVLFASYRQMKAVAEGLTGAVADLILMQGEKARHELLATHRRRIDAGEGSVLFGVASFSEGVDLPGAYCTHVIIAKIPFSVPTSPVEATFAEWLESRGRIPFMEMSVPEASFKLTQSAGRLLRTETDSGRVTVLDRRLIDKHYGKMMVNALPPFRRVNA